MAALVADGGSEAPPALAAAQLDDLTLQPLENSSRGGPELIDTTDNNDFEDEEDDDSDDDSPLGLPLDADSLLGVSISRAQTELKSPTTPAAIKAQALQNSSSYFAAQPDEKNRQAQETIEEVDFHQDTLPTAEPSRKDVLSSSARPPSPWRAPAKDKAEKRSSFVSSILGTTSNTLRPRSGSGSSIIDGIKKRLPAVPSISMPKFMNSGKSDNKDTGVVTSNGSTSPLTRPARSATLSSPSPTRNSRFVREAVSRPQSRLRQDGMDGQTDSPDNVSTSQPGLLRRATSDHSLYLRRAPTGASEFDDYSAFSNVSEMVNSRFKAIQDSFQDSSLKFPRFPTISSAIRNGSPARNVDTDSKNSAMVSESSNAQSSVRDAGRTKVTTDNVTKSKHPILKESLSRMNGDLVILGGYRGSILREAQYPHRQLWVPVKVGLNLRKADLEVGLTREDELKMEESIIADGTLSHIGPVDICRRLLKKCRKCPGVQSGQLRIHDYGYDWRLSLDLLSDRLIRFLESLPCNQQGMPAGERGAWMVAHSLGGLITRHAVNRRPELFAGVVYAGAPQNCINILGPLRNGDDVLFSSRVLTAQVNFSLRTSYALLPQNGRCFINKKTGERYDIDFFNISTWEEYRLSPCIKAPFSRNKPEKRPGIMGSISEAMSQPIQRGSWFVSSSAEANGKAQEPSGSPQQQMKDKAPDVKDDMEENIPDLPGKIGGPMSPTLADGNSSHTHQRPSVATQSTIPLPEAKAYLSTTLAAVLKFKQELSHNPQLQERNAYPPVAILFAKNTPTVYGAFVTSREAIKYDDAFDELAFAAGDGVVLASAAQLPEGYRCVKNGKIETDRGHVGLLGDLESVGKCLSAIIEARERGVGSGASRRKFGGTSKQDDVPRARVESIEVS